MIDEYAERSPPAERRRRLVLLSLFFVLLLSAGAYVVSDFPGFDALSCDRIPGMRNFFIYKVATWMVGALILAMLAYKMLLHGQFPSPNAVVFRRCRIRRGRYVRVLAATYLALSGLLLLMIGIDTGIFIDLLHVQISLYCT